MEVNVDLDVLRIVYEAVKGKVFISDIDSKIERIIKENTDWLD